MTSGLLFPCLGAEIPGALGFGHFGMIHPYRCFGHSTHIPTGCSVNYWAHVGRLELWGHSQHDSEALL